MFYFNLKRENIISSENKTGDIIWLVTNPRPPLSVLILNEFRLTKSELDLQPNQTSKPVLDERRYPETSVLFE